MFNVQHLPPGLVADDKQSTAEESNPPITGDETLDQTVSQSETNYSSVGTLFRSSWQRFASIWTRRFILSLLAGQIVSLCITCTSVATEELTSRNWVLPTTQTLFLCPPFLPPVDFLPDGSVHRYLSLFVIYTPYTIYRCMLPILNIMQKNGPYAKL
jgi:solute carrier family 35 protein F1/2